MASRSDANRPVDRREFLGAATAAGALALLTRRGLSTVAFAADAGAPAAASSAKPNSVINGVRIGCITYSYRDARINTAEDTLKALLRDGLSEVELMDGPIRAYAGIGGGRGPGGRRGPRPGGGNNPPPPPTEPPPPLTGTNILD